MRKKTGNGYLDVLVAAMLVTLLGVAVLVQQL